MKLFCSWAWTVTGHYVTYLLLSNVLPYLSEGRGSVNIHQPPHDANHPPSEALPFGFLDQDGPEDVLKGCLLLLVGWLHERVQGRQREALLVQLQELGGQVSQGGQPHR